MFDFVRELIETAVAERLELVGDAWLALDEFGKISQDDLINEEKKRYLLGKSNGIALFIRPGFEGVYEVFDADDFDTDKTVNLAELPSEVLREIIQLSLE